MAESAGALWPDGNVGVDAQGPFRHVGIARLEPLQDKHKLLRKRRGFLAAADVRARHDLHQPRPASVEVDEGELVRQREDALARVVLQVQALDLDAVGVVAVSDLELAVLLRSKRDRWLIWHPSATEVSSPASAQRLLKAGSAPGVPASKTDTLLSLSARRADTRDK